MGALSIIKKSHQFDGNKEQLSAYYKSWAATYDTDVKTEEYTGPKIVANIVKLISDSKGLGNNISIMDAGCGTGLVGTELAQYGFCDIDGFDLSEEMAERARRTGAYKAVSEGVDLNTLADANLEKTYDFVVCCGVFTVGHVKPESVSGLIRLVRKPGYIVLSTRHSYMVETNFYHYLQKILESSNAELVMRLRDAEYIAEEDADYWVIRAIS